MFTDADSQQKTAIRMVRVGMGNRSDTFVDYLTEDFGVTDNDIVKTIIQAAQAYQDKLVGKTFMYVFNKQQIEVTYRTSNFRHLTGVGTKLSAEDFFIKSRKGTLLPSEIDFTSNHSYNEVKSKLKHIISMANMVTGECLMMKDINTKHILFKYGATNLNFTVCFDSNSVKTDSSNQPDLYFPRSLRRGDCFNKSQNAYVVTHIFCKRSDKKKYDNLLFAEKGETLCRLPKEIREKLGPHLEKGEKFIESCQYLFRESEKILSENPELYTEFLQLKQVYLKTKSPTPVPDITDNMTLAEKFKATEDYYNELCGIIMLDENFKNRYKIARDTYRENQMKNLSTSTINKNLDKHKKHKR